MSCKLQHTIITTGLLQTINQKMPFQRTSKFKYGRVQSPTHKSAPNWGNGAIFLGNEKSRVHPCVQPTEPVPTFASGTGKHSTFWTASITAPPLASFENLLHISRSPKALQNAGETYISGPWATPQTPLRFCAETEVQPGGMVSTRQRASRSTPRPCRECPPPVLLLIESASVSLSL